MKPIHSLLAALLFASVPAAAQQPRDVPVYRGPVVYPAFTAPDQRDFRLFRTRIREGMSKGVSFGGKYAIISYGCGTQCVVTLLGDVTNGRVIPFPLGGEDTIIMMFEARPWHNLATLVWSDRTNCFQAAFVIAETGTLHQLNQRTLGNADVC